MNTTTNRYSNYQNMIGLAEPNWNDAESLGLSSLNVNVEENNYLKDQYGRYFHHFCTTSYLGLDYHPALLNGGGGVAMLGSEHHKNLIHRYGGPSNWSQSLNAAAIGAGRASITLHHSGEVEELQKRLQENIRHFDSQISTEQMGSYSPIRLIRCPDANTANHIAAKLAELGFFTSTVFFPVVAKNKSAIRITLRADMDHMLISTFCRHVGDILSTLDFEPQW